MLVIVIEQVSSDVPNITNFNSFSRWSVKYFIIFIHDAASIKSVVTFLFRLGFTLPYSSLILTKISSSATTGKTLG